MAKNQTLDDFYKSFREEILCASDTETSGWTTEDFLTAVMLEQEKGVLDISSDNAVKSFREKNMSDGAPINAGYMVLEPAIFDYIDGDDTVFERAPLEKLVAEGQLMSYMHRGYWQCMDNKREMDMLEKHLKNGTAPWKKWEN